MNILEILPLQRPLKAIVEIPGSKSYTNRALLLAALTDNRVAIKNPLFSADTKAMLSCLETLGIKLKISVNQIEVIGSVKDIKENEYTLDADLSGTTIRFVLALATIIPGIKTIRGKKELNSRPIKDLVDTLRERGAKITYLEKEGFPPLRIASAKLTPGPININGGVSSQYLSALLMIAPIIGEVIINIKNKQISKPYIDMTIETIQQFGVTVQNDSYSKYFISGNQKYNSDQYLVEGDFSSAGYFFAIAALTKSELTIKNLNSNSKQADKKLLTVLEKMGNKITYGNNEITIEGKGVKTIEIDVTDFPDQAQTLAVLAAFAKGTTKLSGIQTLRVKETNRVLALQTELQKMGIKTKVTNDRLTIFGGNPNPALIDTYHDHRMAMAFAVAGTKLTGIKINHPEVVNKTFPEFWEKLSSLGVKTNNKTNIILVGMRGSGKTTTSKMLAKKLNKKILDLDEELVTKLGIGLAEIINTKGWNFFRDQEALVAKEKAEEQNCIIATGGGVILRKDSVDALKKYGIFIFLNALPKTLAKRIGDDNNRPPLNKGYTSKDELELVLKERETLYKNNADIVINTDNINGKEVITNIISKLQI